jgi:hypothetical protein
MQAEGRKSLFSIVDTSARESVSQPFLPEPEDYSLQMLNDQTAKWIPSE